MHLHHNEQLYNHPHPRFVRKIIEVLDCFISGVEQTLRTLSFFFTFFFRMCSGLKEGRRVSLLRSIVIFLKPSWLGMWYILKYTKDTCQGKVPFNPLLTYPVTPRPYPSAPRKPVHPQPPGSLCTLSPW